MRLILSLCLFLFLVPASALCQEQIREVRVGPNGDQVRIVVAFIEPSQEAYRMQSMIIDLKPVKNSKEASSFQTDLTSTLRSLSTGAKKQMILLLRWKQTGEIELKCDGKWVKQESTPALEKIVSAVKAVIQNVPLNTKTVTSITLPQEVEQKASSILNALDTEDFPCVRKLK